MEIKEITQDTFTSLRPIGEMDANSSIYMDEKLSALLEDGKVNLHIDCSEMTYISSAGLGVFISYIDEIRSRGGKMIFSGMSDSVYDVFELLGLHKIIKISDEADLVNQLFE